MNKYAAIHTNRSNDLWKKYKMPFRKKMIVYYSVSLNKSNHTLIVKTFR